MDSNRSVGLRILKAINKLVRKKNHSKFSFGVRDGGASRKLMKANAIYQ